MQTHVSTARRCGWLTLNLVAAALCAALLPATAAAQADESEAPIAMPRVAATQSAPVALSPEEALWQQILALRQLPSAPAGATQPLENPEFVKSLNQQLEKSLTATNEYVKKWPKGEHSEEAQIQRLDTMRLLAVINKQPLSGFEAEAQKVLKSDAVTNVKAAADYMLMGIRMDDFQKELLSGQMDHQQQEQAWRGRVTASAKQFIEKYPKTAFAERFYVLLIDNALQQENLAEAKEILVSMRENHPDSPFLEEITSAISEVAAATQAAASQAATSQPAGATPVLRAPVPAQ